MPKERRQVETEKSLLPSCAPRASAAQRCGPAFLIASAAPASNFLKLSTKNFASFFSTPSYACLSLHVSRGVRMLLGTFAHSLGTSKPKISFLYVLAFASEPSWMPSRIARVYRRLMRLPTPKPPPDQPVFTSHACAPCFFKRSASSSAYLLGCHPMN